MTALSDSPHLFLRETRFYSLLTGNNSSSTAKVPKDSSSLHFHTGKVKDRYSKIKLSGVLLPKREILLYHLYELGTRILVVHKMEELTVQVPAGKPSAYSQLLDYPSHEVKKEKLAFSLCTTPQSTTQV